MFLKRKKNNGSATQEVLEQSQNFEVCLIDMTKKSERRAWMVAFASALLAILLGLGYIFVMPLKREVPYLVLADPYRGTSTVAQIGDIERGYTSHEFLNKSYVGHFVIARESYDWDVSSRRDRRLVFSMATGSALAEYKNLYRHGNPENPDKVYGPDISLRIKILSTILSGVEDEKAPNAATVRFERWSFDRKSGESRYLDTKLATMKIGYDDNLQMNEAGRMHNPLGFRVYAYRVDPDAFGAATSVPPQKAPEIATQPQTIAEPTTPAPSTTLPTPASEM